MKKIFEQLRRGFTLAEVLITLGIIGVVAAMTIPNLIQSVQMKQLENQIRVAYSTIQQTIRFADDDGVSYSVIKDGQNDINQWFKDFMMAHLKTETVCYNTTGCWHARGVVKTLRNTAPYYESNAGIGNDIITFTTSKGIYFNIDGFSAVDMKNIFGIDTNNSGMIFYFDVNADKKPNVIGKDIYVMAWTEKGLVPAGFDRTMDEVNSNCRTGDGYWCLKKVINEGYTIDKFVWRRMH